MEPDPEAHAAYMERFALFKQVYEDLNEAGVIDPAKVSRIALENAASVAALMLMTEATVVEKPEEKPAAPPMPPGGMDGMY